MWAKAIGGFKIALNINDLQSTGYCYRSNLTEQPKCHSRRAAMIARSYDDHRSEKIAAGVCAGRTLHPALSSLIRASKNSLFQHFDYFDNFGCDAESTIEQLSNLENNCSWMDDFHFGAFKKL